MKHLTFTFFFLLVAMYASCQSIEIDSIFQLPSTARPFTIEDFYELILKNHPVIKQANLLSDVAKQEIRLARGNFDPKLESEYLLKQFKGNEYYRQFDASIKIPTRSPVTAALGVERNKGQQLNPENYISNDFNYSQLYAGISIPLGQGFVTDERRTALQQAQVFSGLLEADQIKIVNKLLLEAAKDYWGWYYSYYNLRLAVRTENVARQVFERVKLNYEGGELAPIDTVQAKTTYIDRQVNRQQAGLDFSNTTLQISLYLWDSLQNPLILSPEFAPVNPQLPSTISQAEVDALVNQAKANHPEVRKLSLKLRQLQFDQRLATEYLKPKINVSYYMLNQPLTPERSATNVTLDDNYKFGFDFSIPILLRKERAKLSQIKLKAENTNYDMLLTTRSIMNEINTAHNTLNTIGQVMVQQRAVADNYQRLVQAELVNLENGESDLFKINVQQEKFFNAQEKWLKSIAEFEKQKALLYWAAGTRPLAD
jgi:outer membrane protein TolC